MSLSIDEQRNLQDLLVLFFPEERGTIASSSPTEQTLDLTETMLIEITKCTKTAQKFIEDLAGNRMIKGFLRKSLKRLLNALKGKDAAFVGNVGCTNHGKAVYKQPILMTLI